MGYTHHDLANGACKTKYFWSTKTFKIKTTWKQKHAGTIAVVRCGMWVGCYSEERLCCEFY